MPEGWELLKAAQNGDESAWIDLVGKYNPLLIRIASLITGTPHLAADLAQETFIRLFRVNIKRTDGSFKYYITKIVHNLALKAYKKQKHETSYPEYLEIIDNADTAVDKILNEERNRLIMQTINSLDDIQRQILILRFYGELSYEDISKLLKLPLGTIKSRIFYAVKACRKKMLEQGVINETL